MTDRDALVLTLIRGLEGAATALDVVDDATHQQIGGLLSPKARRLLAALTAPAPATPTAEAADAADANDAPAAASEEAPEPPAKKPAVFGVPAAAFVVTSFDELPEDALGAIASFSDIKTLTCVATCRALRDAAAKLRPRLEHSLVLKRFPLLTTLETSPTGAPAPHELFRTFAGYSDGDSRRPPRSQPTTALDDYTFLLEFFLWDRKTKNKDRSVFVTTGTLSPGVGAQPTPSFEFTIPGAIMDDAARLRRPTSFKARIVATRQVNGRPQFANLYCGAIEDFDEEGIMFEWLEIPANPQNAGLQWQLRNDIDNDMYCQPELRLFWAAESDRFVNRQSKLQASMAFWTEGGGTEVMSLSDACLCLEHYVGWSE